MDKSDVYLCLPVLNESANLPALLSSLREQSHQRFTLIACVNNYEHWRNNPELLKQCEDNRLSLELLSHVEDLDVVVIDRSSPGNGWPQKKGGVGWARKVAMDHAYEMSKERDLIVCMDADTYYPSDFIQKVVARFSEHPQMDGLAIPYFHILAGDQTDRLILRYEIYMRYYLLNMLMINNPYAFTAIGSAMASTSKAYGRIGGITPVKSGEDFYFIQKLVKNGILGTWCDTRAYPSPRMSSRVLFGTGPAIIKGSAGDWNSYPLYPKASFDKVKRTFELFPDLYSGRVATPMDDFIREQFRDPDIWTPLRNNFKDRKNFVKACQRKIDGLRILQFLRKNRASRPVEDSAVLSEFVKNEFGSSILSPSGIHIDALQFDTSSIQTLDVIRNRLFELEHKMRKERDDREIPAL
jgi:glycosyltransferase involved in cell wall biosynthesis